MKLQENIDKEYYNILQDITKMHWFLLYENYCGIIRKPLYIKQDENFRLHSENSSVIKYRSGWEIYALNGILMSEEIVMTPADELDPQLILQEKNTAIRNEIIKKIGIERVINKLGAKSVDTEKGRADWFQRKFKKKYNYEYELLNFDIIDGRYIPFLRMINPSTGDEHIEGVHPDCDTIKKALAWRDDEEIYQEPIILT